MVSFDAKLKRSSSDKAEIDKNIRLTTVVGKT